MASDPFSSVEKVAQQQQQQQMMPTPPPPRPPPPSAAVAAVTTADAPSKQPQQRPKFWQMFRQHALKTVNCCLLFALVGMSDSSIGAALPAMACLVDGAGDGESRMLEAAPLVLFCHETAVLATALSTGLLNRRLPANLLLAAVSVAMPICFALAGHSHSLATLAAVLSLMGLGEGCLEYLCNSRMLAMFGDRAGPFLQAMFCCQSLGAFVAPLIIGAFVSDRAGRVTQSGGNCSIADAARLAQGVRYPYYLIAVLQLPIALSMLHLAYKEGWEDLPEIDRGASGSNEPSSSDIQDHQEKLDQDEYSLNCLVLFVASLSAFVLDGILASFSGLIYSYSIESVNSAIDKSRTAYLSATFWGFTLLGRLSGIFFTLKISSIYVLFIDLAGLLVSAALFTMGGGRIVVLFLSTLLTGFFISHCMPALLAVTEQFVSLTGCRATALIASAAFGEAVVPVVMVTGMQRLRIGAYPLFHSAFVMLALVLCFFLASLGCRTQRGRLTDSQLVNFLLLGVFTKLAGSEERPSCRIVNQQQHKQPCQRSNQSEDHIEEEDFSFDELAATRLVAGIRC